MRSDGFARTCWAVAFAVCDAVARLAFWAADVMTEASITCDRRARGAPPPPAPFDPWKAGFDG